jgi:hypothetical protein
VATKISLASATKPGSSNHLSAGQSQAILASPKVPPGPVTTAMSYTAIVPVPRQLEALRFPTLIAEQ